MYVPVILIASASIALSTFPSLPYYKEMILPTDLDVFKKHNKFNPALKHQNKHRHIRSRVLSRQYK